jgi:hypothetical protein
MFDGGLLNGFVELNTSSEAASCATTEILLIFYGS